MHTVANAKVNGVKRLVCYYIFFIVEKKLIEDDDFWKKTNCEKNLVVKTN